MSDLTDGGAALAQALFGGQRLEDNARLKREMLYDQQDSGRAELDRKITQAKLERDKRLAQQSYAQSFIDTGVDPVAAGALQNFAIGGLATNLADAQNYDMKRRAEAALVAGGNVDPANAILGALEGKPMQHVTIDDNMQIGNRYSANPTVTTTPIGQSMIRENDAQAANASARAGLANVQAGAGGWNPNSGRGAGKPENFTAPAAALLKALVGDDPAKTQAFQTWRAQHPEFRDGDEALTTYINNQGTPGLKPTRVPLDMGAFTVPVGQDPDLVGELYGIQRDAQTRGTPFTKQQLRAIAEIRGRGMDFTVAPDGRIVVKHAASAAPQPAEGPGLVDRVLSAFTGGGGGSDAAVARGLVTPAPVAPTVAPAAPAVGAPPPAAIAMLRANPQLAAAFEAKYGVSAAPFLGQ